MLQESKNSYRQESFIVPLAAKSRGTNDEPLEPDLFAIFGGTLWSKGSFHYEQLSHSVAIHMIESGCGTFSSGTQTWEADAGTLFCFFPGQYIIYEDQIDRPWHYHWIRLGGRSCSWSLYHAGLTPEAPLLRLQNNDVIHHFQELKLRCSNESIAQHPIYPQWWTWHFLHLLSQENATKSSAVADGSSLAISCRAVIDAEYDRGITVDDLARRLKVERTTLFRHFRASYNESPKQYIDRLRLKKARLLLQSTSRTIQDIAESCGYADADYFGRRFRQEMGQPPNLWRSRPTLNT